MSKISTALKLSLVEQLDSRATPERVKEQIRGALSRGDITLRDIERFTTFKSSTISQVLNDKYEGDTAKLDAALVRYWMNYVAKHSILETRAAAEIHTLLKWAHKKQRIAIIVGDNGRGKTTAVQAYHALHPDDTAYITIDATSRLLEFFEALAKALKIENHMNGPASSLPSFRTASSYSVRSCFARSRLSVMAGTPRRKEGGRSVAGFPRPGVAVPGTVRDV